MSSTPIRSYHGGGLPQDQDTPLKEMPYVSPAANWRVGLYPSCPEFSGAVHHAGGLAVPKVCMISLVAQNSAATYLIHLTDGGKSAKAQYSN